MLPTAIRTEREVQPLERVGSAIADAAARTGVDFAYLLNQAKIESSFNPTARAKTSSATGLYQFIEQTWLGTIKKHGAAHGLGWAAEAIQRGSGGRYQAEPSLRRAILDLRNQPEAAAAMAAEFASDNQLYLAERLTRPVEGVDLYLAHFLGPEGAADFLSAHDADPTAAAASFAPEAARANRSIFYEADGSPRSLGAIRSRFAAKLGEQPQLPSTRFSPRHNSATRQAVTFDRPSEPIAKPRAEYARIAYQMLASIGHEA